MEQFVCGIDGGGTKTSVLCRGQDGGTLDSKVFGPFNLNGIGEPAFRELLDEIISWLKGLGDCKALCIGASGISNERVSQIINETFGASRIPFRLLSDCEIALTGALDGDEGLIQIAGTGSICFGRSASGQVARSGGWGHLIGDSGSGYGLGRDALCAIAHLYDGHGNPTVLKKLLEDGFGLDCREKIISYVYSNDKSAVAALAPLVLEACRLEDKVAMAIVRRNAAALEADIMAVARKLDMEGFKVALMGGLMEHHTCLRVELEGLLEEHSSRITCIDPIHNSTEGAVMEAMKLVSVQAPPSTLH